MLEICPVSVSFKVPEAKSQILIVRSAEPVAYQELVGSTATHRTQPMWPEMTRIIFHGACHSGLGKSCRASRRRGISRVLPGGMAALAPAPPLGATTPPRADASPPVPPGPASISGWALAPGAGSARPPLAEPLVRSLVMAEPGPAPVPGGGMPFTMLYSPATLAASLSECL
jgi:hypothetical protein